MGFGCEREAFIDPIRRDLRLALVAPPWGRLRHDRRNPPNLPRHGLWPPNPYVLLAPPGPAFESFDRMTELPRGRGKQRGRRSASIFDWTRAT
jgi:hypothetical protein